jgi:hypothetical protein
VNSCSYSREDLKAEVYCSFKLPNHSRHKITELLMKLKTLPAALAATLFVAAAAPAHAVSLTVRITNLTSGFHFTPRLLVAHTATAPGVPLFESGTAASADLIAIAEGGDTAPFTATLNADANNQTNMTFGGLVAPAMTSADYTFETNDHPFLSLLTMLIPTNDAFAGLSRWSIPTTPGTYTININAYDSGSEANDEINSGNTALTIADAGAFGGAPGRPGMATPPPTQPNLNNGATGVAVQAAAGVLPVADIANPNGGEGNVHIHRNTLGDGNPTAGRSDLNATVHRWLNPVARLTVIVPAP